MYKTWKDEMDALYTRTHKNWWNTGNRKCATAVTGSLSLHNAESTKEKKVKKENRTC